MNTLPRRAANFSEQSTASIYHEAKVQITKIKINNSSQVLFLKRRFIFWKRDLFF